MSITFAFEVAPSIFLRISAFSSSVKLSSAATLDFASFLASANFLTSIAFLSSSAAACSFLVLSRSAASLFIF